MTTVLSELSSRGFSLSAPIPAGWVVGDRVRVSIRASEGSEILLWASIQSLSPEGMRARFSPELPAREARVMAAEFRHAETISVCSESGRGSLDVQFCDSAGST